MTTTAGSMNAAATMRGTTRYFTGSVAMVSIASSCSVTFIVPISAAMAEPARPATMIEASTGTSSRVMPSATAKATSSVAPNCSKPSQTCSAKTAPENAAVTITTGNDRLPSSSICRRPVAEDTRGR